MILTLALSIDLYMAGRAEESARRAEEAARLNTDPHRQFLGHRQAGASLGDLGRLDEAEAHKRRGVELAEHLGDPKQFADVLGDLAESSRKRGKLPEALAAVDRAAAAVRPTRHLELIRYEILRSWGRFDEALAASDRASRLDPLPTLRAEEFTQGIFAFSRASLLAFQGKPDEARAALAEALRRVAGEAKVTLWCDAARARLDAMQGRREVALRAIDDADARGWPRSPGTATPARACSATSAAPCSCWANSTAPSATGTNTSPPRPSRSTSRRRIITWPRPTAGSATTPRRGPNTAARSTRGS